MSVAIEEQLEKIPVINWLVRLLKKIKLKAGTEWQFFQIPLKKFKNFGRGGNNFFDPDEKNGKFLGVIFVFEGVPSATTIEVAMDHFSFSGDLDQISSKSGS